MDVFNDKPKWRDPELTMFANNARRFEEVGNMKQITCARAVEHALQHINVAMSITWVNSFKFCAEFAKPAIIR